MPIEKSQILYNIIYIHMTFWRYLLFYFEIWSTMNHRRDLTYDAIYCELNERNTNVFNTFTPAKYVHT